MTDQENRPKQKEPSPDEETRAAAPDNPDTGEQKTAASSQQRSAAGDPDRESGSEEEHDRFKDATENFKETTEKLWENTRQAFSTATTRAGQYKRLVQKKIDLAAIHKKISSAHADLGKQIDDLREQGKKSIMNQAEVKQLCQQLDSLKATAAALEEEIENIRDSEHHQEERAEKPED